ncbi:hypothetical protein PF003_g28995 [Phytophthora fragariae]|nr:hypothetical protein PF003_g28995 [Phytophthora fragariae]
MTSSSTLMLQRAISLSDCGLPSGGARHHHHQGD